MANADQLHLLQQGVEVWNDWRKEDPGLDIDLSGANLLEANLYEANLSRANLCKADMTGAYLWKADLTGANLRAANLLAAHLEEARLAKANLAGANLSRINLVKAGLRKANLLGANLRKANLWKADLSGAYLWKADLTGANLLEANVLAAYLEEACMAEAHLVRANLRKANLRQSDLREANLLEANLRGADLCKANLWRADLSRANLSGAALKNANLQNTFFIETEIEQAILIGCRIYGISAWSLIGTPKEQTDLVITADGEPKITVDDLQVAQFIYLLLNNKNVRNVIDTITSKAVLILGRFTDERRAVLDAIHAELRTRNYLPILFDFSGSENRDITETISTLAHMTKFVIADITDAKSIPQELQAIVPNLPSVPIQPILLSSQQEYGMFEHFKRYPWVLPTYYYQNIQEVILSLSDRILNPLEAKVKELNRK